MYASVYFRAELSASSRLKASVHIASAAREDVVPTRFPYNRRYLGVPLSDLALVSVVNHLVHAARRHIQLFCVQNAAGKILCPFGGPRRDRDISDLFQVYEPV